MRIAFLCGSQEAGRDGVGDYTRGLADELRLQGHEVIVIALRDKFVSEVILPERPASGDAFPVLRLPSVLAWPASIALAREQLDRFDPEWVSLQFVCYNFHPKGMVHGLARRLTPLFQERKLHIMFHEIWLCKELGWGGRQRVIGALQRLFIRRFVGSVRPAVMHTSNSTYAALLNRSHIPVTELGLFGNVPIVSAPGSAWIESHLRNTLGDGYRRDFLWLFGFFGALHPQWPPEPLLTHLHRSAQAAGKKAVLLSIGRTGEAGAKLWNRIAHEYADRFTFVCLGEQPAAHVSEYLAYLDYGIATTPRAIIGKSSTVISMLEHGLPVIVNRDDGLAAAAPLGQSDPLLIFANRGLEARLQNGGTRGAPRARRTQTAQQFALALEHASTFP